MKSLLNIHIWDKMIVTARLMCLQSGGPIIIWGLGLNKTRQLFVIWMKELSDMILHYLAVMR